MGFFSDIVKSITGAIGDVLGWVLGIEEPDFDQASGALVNKQSNIEPIPVIYGTRKVGGTRVFVSTGGSQTNEYLYIALALCEGEIEEIGDVYINDVLSTDSKYSGLVSIQKFTGTDNQTYSTLLAGADDTWGANHRLRGVAYLALRLKYDPDVFSSIPEVQAIVKGRKVFDPETSTTAWSDNPALCLRDYLTNTRYGKGLSASLIDDASFITAKSFCNTTVTSSAGLGGSQKIFECNAIIDTSKNLFDNVKILLRGMRGLMPYSNGIYSLLIDKSESSTFDLTPDNITSDLTVASAGKSKKYNKVIVKFANPDANWQSDTVFWPPAGSSEETAFLSEDNNQELSTEITLPTITNYYSARDIARVACLESRASDLTVKLTATSEALSIAAGDVVRLEHPSMGWTDGARQLFRVVGLQLVNTGEVRLTLQKYSSTIYTWDVGADQPDNPATTLPDPTIVAPPTNLSVVARANIADDGATIPYLEITWTAANDAFVNGYLVTVTPSTGNPSSFTVSTTSYDFFVLDSTKTYSVSVRAINALGARSAAVTVSDVSPIVDTTAPGVPTNPVVTGEFKQIKVEWDNPTDSDFSYVEIKRSGTGVEANAVTIAVTRADYFIDGPYVGVAQRYYWLRAVDLSGNASAWVYAGSGTTIQLVPNDFDDGIITIDYLNAGLQTSINNAVDTTTFTDGIADLRQEILNVEVETGDVLNLENGQDFLIQNLGDVAIYVSESNQILNQNISNVQSTVTGLENTIVDLVSGVSDVYVTPEPPVAGVDGIPDPIPTFSRWYDSDDSNEPYYWDGTEWVSLADPRIASNAADIVTLQSGLNTANSNISANSTAITALDTLTITQGDSITSLSSDVTTLQSDLTSAEGDITANASAISGLDTRVTAAEGTITTQSSDITALETSVSDLETDTTANTSAISGLDTRVTQTESDITANSTSITALETIVEDATTGVVGSANAIAALDTRVTTAEGNITTNASDITALELTVNDPDDGVAANASAVSSLDARVTTAENTLSATASDTTDLQVSFTDLTRIQDESDNVLTTEGGQELILNLPTDVASATGAATASLDTRITAAEGTITVQSSDIVSLRADLTSLDGEVSGNATALETLTTRVTTAEGSITSNATDITSLESSLSLANTDITNNATAITSLDTRVTSAEGSITSQASDIASLQADVTSLDSTVSGNSTAISGLDARVTSAEGTITSQASDITSIESSVTDLETDTTNNATAITSLDTRVTSAEGSITSQATDITNIQSSITDIETDVSGNADAITGLTTRVTQTETDITSQASDLTALETDVTNLATDVSGNADAITGIDTRVTSAEGTITSQSSDITALESSVTDLETNTTNNATAITSLDTRVTDAESDITSQASAITTLETSVGENTTSISTAQTTIDGITAQYSVVIDNNDHVSGFGLVSDIIAGNPTSAFIVNADQFAIGGAGVITDEYPFVVYTQNTTVSKGGENYTLAAGAYIADAFIQTAAIDSAQIRDAAITTAKIDDAQITTAKIGDAQITTAKIDDAQITSAKINDLAVDTIKIADQAVTLPESTYTESAQTKNSGVTSEQVLQTVTVDSTGAPTEIFGSFTIDSTYNLTTSHTIRIKRGTTTLSAANIVVGSADEFPFAAAVTDSLTTSGSRTYTITAQGFGSWSIKNRYLRTLELKK